MSDFVSGDIPQRASSCPPQCLLPASLTLSAFKDSSRQIPVCPSQGGVHLRMAPLLKTVPPLQSSKNSLPGRRRHICRECQRPGDSRARNLVKASSSQENLSSTLLRPPRSLDTPAGLRLAGTACHLPVLSRCAPGSCVCQDF